ncbi:MAG: 16S rRNA (cytosine(967)-C(5))-methyltransferase RsmB [Lachnospiraceae bacterium]|nr:16S rRNA (cytosine(967)-C(5))-methyltransferase RsmB [Lachnospiraceae bacterium]
MSNAVNTRELAVELLMSMEKDEGFSSDLIRGTLNKYDYLDRRDKAFLKRLAEGCLEKQLYLDFILNQYSNTPVKKMKPFIRALLRSSLYQILFMEQVPDRAVVNEAVKLAGKRGFVNLKGFVNGVLRKTASAKEDGTLPAPSTENLTEFWSVTHSIPAWLIEKWRQELVDETTLKMLDAFEKPQPVTIRLREFMSETERQELLSQMEEQGAEITPHPYLPYAYCLTRLEGVHHLPGYSQGLFAVQDASSMLCVEAANIHPGDFILDVCAAPGGKACLAADKTGPEGKVLARDVSDIKLSAVEENAGRLQLDNLNVQLWDAAVFDKTMEEKADAVLADLPCSGLGILGKKQDIRYHVTPESLQELQQLQRQILAAAVRYVKPGGTLIYSTCTIDPLENEDNRTYIIEELGLHPESITESLPESLRRESAKDGYIQLIPGQDNCDGFFISRFRKPVNQSARVTLQNPDLHNSGSER